MSTTTPPTNSTPGEANLIAEHSNGTVEPTPDMAFRVVISRSSVTLRWLKGIDEVLWDSFCGMMRRKLTGNVAAVNSKGQGATVGRKKDDGPLIDSAKEATGLIVEGS
jgi:hypothetical protein